MATANGRRNRTRGWLRPAVLIAFVATTLLVGSASPAQAFSRDLQYGSTGSDVKCWQVALNAYDSWAHAFPTLAVDGDFGSKTRAATEDYQSYKYFHLAVDGIVGPKTSHQMRVTLQGFVEYAGDPVWAEHAEYALDYCGTRLP